LKLLRLPAKARKALAAGEISASTAQLIGRVPSESLRKEASDAIVGGQGRWGPSEPLSFRAAKEWIESYVTRELKGSPFDQADAALVKPAGVCDTCPKRTGNARELYPDGRADICTDTACYDGKVRAHGQLTLARAKADGRKVLSAKDAKTLFADFYDHQLNGGTNFVDLDADCYETGAPAKWRSHLLPDCQPDIVLAVDPKGRVRELVPKSRAAAILRQKKLVTRQPTPASRVSESWKKEQQKRDAEKAKRVEVAKVVALATREAVLRQSHLDGPLRFMRVLTRILINDIVLFNDAAEKLVAKSYGVANVNDAIESLGSAGCIALVCESLVAQLEVVGREDDDFVPFFECLGVDRAAIAAGKVESNPKKKGCSRDVR